MIRRITALIGKEISTSAASPAAWIFLIFFLILSGFCAFVLGNIFASGQADITPFFDWLPYLFLLIVPALAMPMWSEERRIGVFELTLSFPASLFELVFGKFIAGLILLTAALLLTFSIPLTSFLLGAPDAGAIFCGYFGALLLGSVYLAMATFCSSVSKSQTASFLLSILLCGLFVFMGMPKLLSTVSGWIPERLIAIIASGTFLQNYQGFQKGLLDSSEITYCITLTGLFLALTCFALRFAASGCGSLTAPGAFSDASMRKELRHLAGKIIYALLLTFALNIISGTWQYKLDFSGDRAYSISRESEKLAVNPGAPVTLRFYASLSNPAMPQPLKKYAERVKWLLEEFVSASKGKLTLICIDPEQDSIDEEAAAMDGVVPLQTSAGDRFYLGLSATCAEKVTTVPFLSPQQETHLEYDIARITLNAASDTKPVIGVLSPFAVMGITPDFSTLRQTNANAVKMERPWFSMSELAKDYEIRMLPLDLPVIPSDVKALLIINPVEMNSTALYAIDQYLLNGGRAAVFLDPRSFYAALKSKTDYSLLNKLESDMKPLIAAWGVQYNPSMMAADMVTAYRKTLPDRMITNPMALHLTAENISRKNPLFSHLNLIAMYFTGIFQTIPLEGVEYETLLATSPQSQIVSSLLGNRPELVIKNFTKTDTEFPLALRIKGKLPTAFPDGAPDKSVLPANAKHLEKGIADSEIFLFGDSDMLFNDVCVTPGTDSFGQKIYKRSNDNVTMLQNLAESMTGSRDLASVRGRVPMSRPLTAVNEMKAKAELKYKNRILELEKEFSETQAKWNYLKRQESATGKKLSPENQAEMRKFQLKLSSAKRELKEMRGNLKSDLERLDTQIKIINIILVPAIIALCGLIWSILRLSKGRKK